MPLASPPLDLLPVFNAQPGATLLLTPDWVIMGASDDYLAVTLTQRETLVGQFIFDAFPDNPKTPEANAVANVRASLARVLATRQPHRMAPQHYDVPDPARPGHFVERHWQPRHTPVLDAAGQVQFIIQSVQDITASRRAEQALHESQAREQAARAEVERQRGELQRLFEQAPVAMALFQGPDYRIELANEPMATIWGRTLTQVLGQPVFEALPYVRNQGFEALFADVLAQGTEHNLPEVPVTIDRAHTGQPTLGYFNLTYRPQRDSRGQITGIFTIAQEVTEQVLARQRVEQLNQELEARVQQRTREQEDQQRLLGQILAQVPAAITTLHGPDHRFAFANERYQRLVEGRVVEGQTVAETLPEVAEQGFIELLDNVYRTGQTFEGKEIAIMLAQPGQPPVQHYLDFTYQSMPDEHGQTQGLLVFAVDVTEQVRIRRQAAALQAELLATAQRQAQEREAFHNVFEQTPALVALLRASSHRFEYVNSAYRALFPGRQLVGLSMAEAAPETREQGFVALLDRVYKTGETYYGLDVPFATKSPDGGPTHTTYFNFTYQAYRENGQIAGISIFAFDVNESVLARQEREAQRQQLEQLFMQAPAPIVIFDGPELVYQLVNPAYQQIFPGRELLGKPLLAALPELEGSPLVDSLREVYHTGQPFTAQELPLRLARHAGGPLEDIYWTFTYQARRNAYGQIDGALAFAYDVTEQVRARQQVQGLNEELAAINEEMTATNEELHESNTQLLCTNADLDPFVYAASHDLKAPITNIEGLLEALREYLPTHEQEPMVPRLVGMMEGAIQRFQQTVAHLTDVTRLQAGSEPVTGDLDVPGILEDVRLDIMPLLESTHTQLRLDVPACPGVHIPAKHLRSILFNLLSNAVKYRAPDRVPLVQVRTHCTASRFVLEVQDNGLGLDKMQQEQLFTMFRRLHTHVEGSGVGLYLIRRMIELAKGTITVASQPGVGSTFTVTLPCA